MLPLPAGVLGLLSDALALEIEKPIFIPLAVDNKSG
jgi:hypothetical protein